MPASGARQALQPRRRTGAERWTGLRERKQKRFRLLPTAQEEDYLVGAISEVQMQDKRLLKRGSNFAGFVIVIVRRLSFEFENKLLMFLVGFAGSFLRLRIARQSNVRIPR